MNSLLLQNILNRIHPNFLEKSLSFKFAKHSNTWAYQDFIEDYSWIHGSIPSAIPWSKQITIFQIIDTENKRKMNRKKFWWIDITEKSHLSVKYKFTKRKKKLEKIIERFFSKQICFAFIKKYTHKQSIIWWWWILLIHIQGDFLCTFFHY